jgi:hypothetical protein
MKFFTTRSPRPLLSPWLVAVTLALPLAFACSEDEAPPAKPPTFELEIVGLDGDDAQVARPRCDGTLGVTVAISPSGRFSLRPPHACGTSKLCGYVRAEAFDSAGELLAKSEAVTTTALLELDPARLPELARIRATLIRGVDQEIVTNPDDAEVTVEIEPTVVLPEGCDTTGQGGAGAGGSSAGGSPGAAGAGDGAGANAGGATSGGAPALGGAAGAAGAGQAQGGAGGAGGASDG